MQYLHTINESNAKQIAGWMQNRQGIVVWGCLDFSNAGQTWTGPYLGPDGHPATKPHWSATNEPVLHITDPAQIGVVTYKEVKRVRIHLRMGSSGLKLTLTGASSKKVRQECEKAGEGATYVFDGDEAIILAPAGTISLLEWIMRQEPVKE